MEITEFFRRRTKERWTPQTEIRHLMEIVDTLDEGGFPVNTEVCPEGTVRSVRKYRKWAENRLKVLRARLAGKDIRYEVTGGRGGGLTTEERNILKEKRILQAVRTEIEEMSSMVDRGVATLNSTEEPVTRLPPFEQSINRSQLARRVGVSVSYISRILSGQRQPSLHVLHLIAGVWGVGLEDCLVRIRSEIAQGDSKHVQRRPARGVHRSSDRRTRAQQ